MFGLGSKLCALHLHDEEEKCISRSAQEKSNMFTTFHAALTFGLHNRRREKDLQTCIVCGRHKHQVIRKLQSNTSRSPAGKAILELPVLGELL